MKDMLEKTISRRSFITASASIAGLGALSSGLGMGLGLLDSSKIDEQQKFMSQVLTRYTGHSDKIKPEYIELFTARFTEVYGAVDYQVLFGGPIGEFRLIKLFLRSVFRTA